MDIQATTSYTITINGVAYAFPDPHPVVDLIDQLTAMQDHVANVQRNLDIANAEVASIQAQITALCTTPA